MEISFLSFLGGLAALALLVSSGLGLAFICFVLPAWLSVGSVDYSTLYSWFTGPPIATQITVGRLLLEENAAKYGATENRTRKSANNIWFVKI